MTEPSKPVVLIAERLSDAAVDALGPDVAVRHCDGTDRAALLAAVADASALLVRSATRVDADVLGAGRRLRVVGRAGVGVDNIDVPAATRSGVTVVNARRANVVSAAELTVGLLLASARHVVPAGATLRAGRWQRAAYVGVELSGKTLGLVGLGQVGSLVARRLAGFDMSIIAHDPYADADSARALGVEMVDLDDLLERSDFLSVHVPKTPATVGMIGAAELANVKPTVRIVNTARGGVVDEEALATALAEGRVAGAAVDVYATEPCTDSPLFSFDNVVATPHLGASTAEAQQRAGVAVARSVLDALAGYAVPDAVNAPATVVELHEEAHAGRPHADLLAG